jgi:hypothetical protein
MVSCAFQDSGDCAGGVQLIDIIRFDDDGLAREHWGAFDAMKIMQQLGVVPAGPA